MMWGNGILRVLQEDWSGGALRDGFAEGLEQSPKQLQITQLSWQHKTS